MFMDKTVTACDLPEIVASNYKELTYNSVKDICVDEGVPMMQEKFLFNGKDSVKVNVNHLESKSSEEKKFEEFVDDKHSRKLHQANLIVTREAVNSEVHHGVGCDLHTSTSISKQVLTLGDIISMEDSQKPPNNNGREESVDRETEEEKTEEPKADNLRYLSSEMSEPENPSLKNVLEDSILRSRYKWTTQHLLSSNFPNGFGERSFSEAESGLAHISYNGPISVSGSLSVRSDGSTVSARSFTFPILQSEWNGSPVRMVKSEKRKLRKEKGWRHYSILLCCRF